MDSCKPGTETTDRELDILDFTDLIVDPTGCTKFTDDSTDFTDPTIESTGCTDCTKPTDVRKRSMSDCKDLQYTTFPQLSALLVTQPTSDSQEMP